jgi:hypothetical protein
MPNARGRLVEVGSGSALDGYAAVVCEAGERFERGRASEVRIKDDAAQRRAVRPDGLSDRL